MTVNIENEYPEKIEIDYLHIIHDIVTAAADYVHCPYEVAVNVLVTDNEQIQIINREQRNIDQPTDVLSFPMIDFDEPEAFAVVEEHPEDYFDADSGELNLGDIVISYDKVLEQSKEYGHSPERELAFLTAHSMLHLSGYDHIDEEERKVMEAKQEELLESKGYTRD